VRIDVADPGSERLAIVAALVSAGYDVRAIEIRDVPLTRADLVVLAGDARDALEALRTLRDDGTRPDVPVVLVGTPEGTDPIASGPGFGAERVLGRPVDEEQLVEAVRQLVRPRSDDVSIVERVPELTLELAQRERAAGWRTNVGEVEDEPERDDPSGVSAIHPMSDHDEPDGAPSAREARDAREQRTSSPPTGTTGSGRLLSTERPSPSRRPSVPPPPTGVSVVERRDRASEMPPAMSTPGFATGGTGPGTGSDVVAMAPISDQLRALLAQADRRVFPSLAAIDVSIPAGEASAFDLVPDEFLDDAPLVDLEPEEETLFLPAMPPSGWASGAGSLAGMPAGGAPSVEPDPEPAKKTAPGTPGTLSQRPPRPSKTMLTGGSVAGVSVPGGASPSAGAATSDGRSVSRRGELPATLPDDASLGVPSADGTRRLALAPGAMLRALVAMVLHRSTTKVEVRAPKAATPEVTLFFSRGELVAIDGQLHREALGLARATAGSATRSQLRFSVEDGVDEESARERLVSLVERREVSLATSAFLAVAAERTLLARVVALAEGEARFCPTSDREAPPRLGRTGPLLLGLARSLDASVLTRVAAHGVYLAPSRSFAAVCEALEAPSELVALFERASDGVSPTDVARASLVLPGLVGMVAALLAAGGLSALSREDDGGLEARAAEALVHEHARRAEDADYFALLGVPHDAGDAAIHSAADGRVAMLAALPLDALGLGALSAARRLAIEAVEEARDALESSRLRELYARALVPPPTSSARGTV
jgi:hypothetical protein